jgi:D-threo-aldose 1-dehydrogenase
MRLTVPGLSIATTHLGYGCSQLMGGISYRDSVILVETAFDSGIRHFDTAPSYGYGQAERVLGETLRSRRHQITIATKFGILPPRNQTTLGVARRILAPVLRQLPSVKSRLSRAAGRLAERARFSPDELRRSIDASLSALRTDYIDILLLHEAVAGDLGDELFDELERSVKEGKIRSFGVGSEPAAVAQVYQAQRRFCPIMQFEWSVLSGKPPAFPGSFLITHRSLSAKFIELRSWLDANPQVTRAWSRELSLNVATASVLARLMLVAARNANPDGILLFSSRNLRNIRTNAELMLDSFDPQTGAAFAALVARDAPTSLLRTISKLEVAAIAGR